MLGGSYTTGCSVCVSSTVVAIPAPSIQHCFFSVSAVMAQKIISNRVVEQYCEHGTERMITMKKQIAELLEEDHHDGIRIDMEDKKMFFRLKDYWMEFTDIWKVAGD